jgi:hypothetical protein
MMRLTSKSLPLVLVAAMLGGCGGQGAEQLTLAGRVIAGPSCPVESQSPDPSCADRPVDGAVLVVRGRHGGEVTRVTADAEGHFSVALPAGAYAIVPQPVEGLLGTAPTIGIELLAGEPLPPLTVTYDTGIR